MSFLRLSDIGASWKVHSPQLPLQIVAEFGIVTVASRARSSAG